MSQTVFSTYYVSIPERPHFSELFAFVNNSVLIVNIFLFSLLELELLSVQGYLAGMGHAFARVKAAGA
jgi:hypothetical protein